MGSGFPKQHRLLKRPDFLRAQRCGIGVRCRVGLVLVYLRGDEDHARLGIVASRKMGNAVARNRAKRRTRDWFRRLEAPPVGVDVVVILRSAAASSPCDEVQHELSRTLPRALKKARAGALRKRSVIASSVHKPHSSDS